MSDIQRTRAGMTGFFNVAMLFMVGTEVISWAIIVEATDADHALQLAGQKLLLKYPNATGISGQAEGLSAFTIGKIVQKYGDWN